VPEGAGSVWAAVARAAIELKPPPPAEWFAYGQQHRTDLSLEFVEKLCGVADNKAGLLSQMLGPRPA
jgi:hypothetical protein